MIVVRSSQKSIVICPFWLVYLNENWKIKEDNKAFINSDAFKSNECRNKDLVVKKEWIITNPIPSICEQKNAETNLTWESL